jgi:succinate-semialdehyde dehydrogenase / glutarate-semialdehyde dehydrogenase
MTAVSDPRTSKVAPLLQALAQRVKTADPSRHRGITNAMTGESVGRVPHCTRDDVVASCARQFEVVRTRLL